MQGGHGGLGALKALKKSQLLSSDALRGLGQLFVSALEEVDRTLPGCDELGCDESVRCPAPEISLALHVGGVRFA